MNLSIKYCKISSVISTIYGIVLLIPALFYAVFCFCISDFESKKESVGTSMNALAYSASYALVIVLAIVGAVLLSVCLSYIILGIKGFIAIKKKDEHRLKRNASFKMVISTISMLIQISVFQIILDELALTIIGAVCLAFNLPIILYSYKQSSSL